MSHSFLATLHFLIFTIQGYSKALILSNVHSTQCVPYYVYSFIPSKTFIWWCCAISWVISFLMTMRVIVIYITIIKSEIWIISHWIGIDQKTMVWAACIAILYSLILKSIFTIIWYVHTQFIIYIIYNGWNVIGWMFNVFVRGGGSNLTSDTTWVRSFSIV